MLCYGMNCSARAQNAKPPSVAKRGMRNVWLVAGRWNRDFLDEVSLFPNGAHDDQVDAFSGAFASLAARKARILA